MSTRCCLPSCPTVSASDRVDDLLSEGWTMDSDGEPWCPACSRAFEEALTDGSLATLGRRLEALHATLPPTVPAGPVEGPSLTSDEARELLDAARLAGLPMALVAVSQVEGHPGDREVSVRYQGGSVSACGGSLDEARTLLLARLRAGEGSERGQDRAGRKALALVTTEEGR